MYLTDEYRLTSMQFGMLFHSISAPTAGFYVGQVTCRLSQETDLRAFEQAWQHVVQRHGVLRTSFVWKDHGEPLQRVHAEVAVAINRGDWTKVPEESLQTELESFLAADRARGFDLSTPPLMRWSLFHLPQNEQLFVWSHHHALLDGRARVLLLKEVSKYYEVFRQGQTIALPTPPSYGDYVEWCYNQDYTDARNYWQELLRGFSSSFSITELFKADPVDCSDRCGAQQIRISPDCGEAIRQITQRLKVTPTMALQAAWGVTLGCYTGERDIIFGETRACRRGFRGAASVIGVMINTVPVRISIDGSNSFLDLLHALRDQHLRMREFENLSLSDILTCTGIAAGTPLFETIVVVEERNLNDALMREGCAIWKGISRSSPGHYPLALVGFLQPELSLEIAHDRFSFSDEAAQGIARQFEAVLESLTTTPAAPLQNVVLLKKTDIFQIEQWSTARIRPLFPETIAQRFQQQVRQTPSAVAIVGPDQAVSYFELNRRANQWAHYLKSIGIGPEMRVGLYVERSVEMIVCMLGIMKAGGVCVPLDSRYPVERILYMLKDSRAQVLLTQRKSQEQVRQYEGHLVYVDREPPCAIEFACQDPAYVATGDNLSYITYTSGSTGVPKGVCITQSAIVRLVSETDYLAFNNTQVFLQLASASFDASFFEIWGSLLNGARLVVIPDCTPSLEQLGEVLERYKVTTLWLTAGLFHEMVDHQVHRLCGLKQLLAGGDVLSVRHVEKFLAEAGNDACLINGYGPTENTTFTSCHRMGKETRIGHRVPIGRPIANTKLYLLDESLRLVPVGGVGELYIGGTGLARGYTDSALSAERFIPDAVSGEKGARLYRTGDRARWRIDGTLDFLGRRDSQVKIRGYRVEPGEVESALQNCEGVDKAAVIVQQRLHDKRLIVFVTTPGNQLADQARWRKALQQKLPEYMIPGAFVVLENLPLTANGKVDRQALAGFNVTSGEQHEEIVNPRNSVEELLSIIWADLLDLERVSTDISFFDLGGNSLLAMRLRSRICATFGVEVDVKQLLQGSTISDLAICIQEKMSAGSSRSFLPIERRLQREQAPLSFAQERLWFMRELAPESVHYNIPMILHLSGPLNCGALEKSIEAIVARHEVLRTTFRDNGGDLVQVVHGPEKRELALVDLRDIPPDKRENELEQGIRAIGRKSFDLTCDMPLRAALFRCGPDTHTLFVAMHHIAADGWSVAIFMRELAEFYQAFSTGQSSPMPALPIQYADYAIWEKQWLAGEILAQQLDYWKNRLAGASGVLELPSYQPRPAVQKHNGARRLFFVPEELRERLRKLGRQRSFTLHMCLSAAFAALLHLYTGKDDILVGTPVAGRNRQEIEPLIGFFVNTLVLRSNFSKALTFSQLLEQMRETMLDAYAHQDLPFEKLLTELKPKRDLTRQPLVQVMIVLQETLPEQWILGDVIARPGVPDNGTAKMDLLISLTDELQGIRGILEYDTDLFDEPMMERLTGHFQAVLATLANAPQTHIKETILLSEAEQKQLSAWNRAPTGATVPGVVHRLFEMQADCHPDAIALACEERSITYAELNRRANQLAHYLRKLDVGPDVSMGIYMDRSLEMVIAILGVLKAGGAYVPLDPNYPAERVRFMVSDSTVQLLLTQHSLLQSVAQCGARVLALDLEWNEIALQSIANPVDTAATSNIAYVIYTSGSTGKPKGVMVPHSAIVQLLNSAQKYYGFNSTDVWTLFHSYTFDFSVWEIWGALAFGGRLEVVPFHVARSPEEFYQLVHTAKVTVLNQTPSAFQQFIEQDSRQHKELHLRYVIFGGEALVFRGLAPWFARHRKTQPVMVNMFGITETTVHVTLHQLQKDDVLQNANMIGRPLPGWQVYVLNESMQMLPLGVPGELYVGGAGLARGYLNRPELTAERFVPHPFGNADGERLYRTGDRGRFRPDGTLEYLGRLDHQIKIRGYRIELAEIESTLEGYPGVTKAVVLVQEAPAGDKRLIAYIAHVGNADNPKTTHLRNYLRRHLPDFMIPAAFVSVDKFRLTHNGKVDRQELLSLCAAEPDGEDYISPRTTAEQLIAAMWSEVLNVEPVGANSNFFDLGGHSLLAVKIASRIRAAFQIQLPLRNLFEHPVLLDLADHVTSLRNNQQNCSASAIHRSSRTGELPLSFNQQGRLLRELADSLQGVRPRPFHIVFGLRLRGELEHEALRHTLHEIVKRHEILRMSFEQQSLQSSSGLLSFLQPEISPEAGLEKKLEEISRLGSMLFKTAIYPDAGVYFSLEDCHGLTPAQLEIELTRLVDRESRIPFDYCRPPLMRSRLLTLAARDHLLLITMHHMISDQWSIEVFRKEFVELYSACLKAPLASMSGELPLQYVDFAAWQREYLTPRKLQDMIAYWKKRWSEFSLLDVRKLPFASPVRVQSTEPGRMVELVIGSSLFRDLGAFVRSRNITLNVVLLAGLNILLHLYTGERSIGIWGHFANRIHPQTENLIGWFANNHLIGVALDQDDRLDDVIHAALNAILDADAHQEIPFPVLWMAALREAADHTETQLHPQPYLAFDFKSELFQTDTVGTLTIEQVSFPGHGLQLALYLSARAGKDQLTISAHYCGSIFSSEAMHNFLHEWQKILESMIATPRAKIADLAIFAEGYSY